MGKSKIEWTDRVWNPVTGCTKISEGCRNCYAERMSKRLAGRAGYPEDGFKVTLHPERLEEPLRWKKPSRIFVCSMGDLFHKDVPDEFIDEVLCRIALSTEHTFLVLTKRPERMARYFFINQKERLIESRESRIGRLVEKYAREVLKEDIDAPFWDTFWAWPLPNLWLGVSVEDQKSADERIPLLLDTPAAKRFVSYEPGLGAVDFENIIRPDFRPKHPYDPIMAYDALRGNCKASDDIGLPKIDWIIMGGESGPGARPMHPDWARSVRDQCTAAGVPFFLKQIGEWEPDGEVPFKKPKEANKVIPMYTVWSSAGPHERGRLDSYHVYDKNGQATRFKKIGKHAAGCLLDGKEHKEMPGNG